MVILFSADRKLCNSTICQHEGTCIDAVNGSYYYCQCKPGFEGINCEIDTRTGTGIIHYIVGTNVCLYDLLLTNVVDEFIIIMAEMAVV